MPFEFATATRIIFGAGSISQAGSLAKEFGRIALVVTGRDPTRAKRLLDALREVEVRSIPFAVEGEPDLEVVRRGVAKNAIWSSALAAAARWIRPRLLPP
jgi:alcohol dehydrogenase class IV